jgi:hypothetical protein
MMSASTRLASLSLLALFCAACGDDKAQETDSSTSTGIVGTEPTTTAGTTENTTGEPIPFVPIPARGGIEIEWIEANQGVGVEIGRDGAGVGGEGRSSYLIQNRVTLIRAFWKDLPADWIPRKIEGRLTVKYPDGSEVVLSSKPMVDQSSFVGSLDRSFYWGLMKEQVVPGITFNVELWEVAAGQEDVKEGTNPPRLPYTGNAFVGIEKSDQVMKVTLVPFNYDSGDGCKTKPDTSDETMQIFQDAMYMMNPLDKLDFTLHAPIDWNEKLSDFNELNSFMSGLRADEGAEPERYYYGLVDVCGGGLGGAGGKAYGIPQGGKMGDAYQRVSSGLSIDVKFSSETFVHEVGHSQGRYHVKCSGEAGTDPNYPTYPDEGQTLGEIHDWGFGVINFKLYHPTVHKDYMTYCSPTWASTYGWNKVYPIIEALSSWDDAGAPKPDDPIVMGSILVGSVYPDGKETWISVPGAVNPEDISAVHSVEFTIDGKVVQQPAALLPQPEGDVVLVVTELPERWDAVTQMAHLAGPKRIAVPVHKVDQHHQRKLKTAN